MAEIEEIYNVLTSQDYAKKLFSELGKFRKDGQTNFKTNCPNCGGNDFSFSTVEPVYHCFKCQESGDWLTYLQKHRGLEFKEALQYLAQEAGVKLDSLSRADKKAYKKKKTRAGLLNEAQKLFVDDLWSSEGSHVLDYLQERGYKEKEIKSMGLGAYTSRQRLESHLKDRGFYRDQMKEAGLWTGGEDFGFGETHQLAIVWRDRASRPSGLVCRATGDVEPKYLYGKGLKKSQGFIGYEQARGEEAVIVVEGILDSLYLNNFDYPAVAVGGSNVSDSQLRALEDSGTEEILIALDPDRAGKEGTEKIVKQLQGAKLRPYVIELPEGYDPDQLLREKEPATFKQALNRAVRGSKWLGPYIASNHNLDTDRGVDKAVSQAMDTWEGLERGQRSNFRQAIEEALPISSDQLEERIEKQKQELTQEKAINSAKSVESKLAKFRQEGDIVNLQRTLENGLDSLKEARGITVPEPYKVDDFLQDINKAQTGLKTGFNSLDKYLEISRGALTFVAGRPGHGKTTLMLNVLLNMVENYPDQNFYYFSYEEARDRLSLKLIMNLAEYTLNKQTNFNAYLNYFKEKRGTEDQVDKIEKALSQLYDYTEENRLYLVAEAMKADRLASTIHHLANRDDNVGAIFIDYIQKVEPPTSQDQRYREIAKVTERLRETAQTLSIPIIAGAQLNRNTTGKPKMDHLRESGDIEQDANLILGLVDASQDEVVEGEDMKIYILKNREGPTEHDRIKLKWDKQNFNLKEFQSSINY